MRAERTIFMVMIFAASAMLSACARADITSRADHSMIGTLTR